MPQIEVCERMTDYLTESELYQQLGALTKKKDEWEASIPYVLSLLDSASVKIRAKALWLLGEMGLDKLRGPSLEIQRSVFVEQLKSPIPSGKIPSSTMSAR